MASLPPPNATGPVNPFNRRRRSGTRRQEFTAATSSGTRRRLSPPRPASQASGGDGRVRCACCSAPMDHPTLVVADACQAYEVLSSLAISQSVDSLFEAAFQKTKRHTLSVSDEPRGFRVPWGGNFKVPHSERTIFSSKSMRRAIFGFVGIL